jgi:tRNA (adenine22-N1)-methyltransferase
MGGSTIRQILENAGPQAFLLKQLVLQPAAGAGLLREWLADHGWRIAGEDLVKDGGRFYETISAVPGREETRDPVLLSIGPRLYAMKHPLLSELLTLEIKKCRQIITALRKSAGGKAAAKKTELQERIKKLELIIKCLLNAKP